MRPKLKRTIFHLSFFAISAALLVIFLEYRYYIHNWSYTWRFVCGSPIVYLYNVWLMFCALYAIWAIIRRPAYVMGIMWTFITVLTYIHINKYASRGTPILPEDFQLASQAASLSKFVAIDSILKMIIAIGLAWVLFYLLDKKLNAVGLNPSKRTKWTEDLHPIQRISVFLICSLLLFFCTDFVRHHDGRNYSKYFLGTYLVAWNQNENYSNNGFILGFLYNLQKFDTTEPDGYGEEPIKEYKQQYDEIANKQNADRIDISKEDVSVVTILNESFFDPTIEFMGKKFTDYYQYEGGDITPVLHDLQTKYPSGSMYSIDYGGGTANIEFEALTGMTNYWLNTVPYTSLIPKAGEIPSIASTLTLKGYSSTAIHPYNNGMYKRNIALANEGYQAFISQNEMKHQEHDGASSYINDRSAYNETLDLLKSNTEKQVLTLITMQNHTPYKAETYKTHDFKVTNSNITDVQRTKIETYFQSLHNSDKYLGEFIEGLEQLDKKVIVLFFGDHSAGLFDITNKNEDPAVRNLSRLTPYFFYNNFGFEGKKGGETKLATTTPNCMINTMFNHFNYRKTSMQYLLDEVCAEEPILTSNYIGERDVATKDALKKYQLITYDIMSGKKYWMQD